MKIVFLTASALLAFVTSAALSLRVSATDTPQAAEASASEIVQISTGPERSTDLYLYLPSEKVKAVVFVSNSDASRRAEQYVCQSCLQAG